MSTSSHKDGHQHRAEHQCRREQRLVPGNVARAFLIQPVGFLEAAFVQRQAAIRSLPGRWLSMFRLQRRPMPASRYCSSANLNCAQKCVGAIARRRLERVHRLVHVVVHRVRHAQTGPQVRRLGMFQAGLFQSQNVRRQFVRRNIVKVAPRNRRKERRLRLSHHRSRRRYERVRQGFHTQITTYAD